MNSYLSQWYWRYGKCKQSCLGFKIESPCPLHHMSPWEYIYIYIYIYMYSERNRLVQWELIRFFFLFLFLLDLPNHLFFPFYQGNVWPNIFSLFISNENPLFFIFFRFGMVTYCSHNKRIWVGAKNGTLAFYELKPHSKCTVSVSRF